MRIMLAGKVSKTEKGKWSDQVGRVEIWRDGRGQNEAAKTPDLRQMRTQPFDDRARITPGMGTGARGKRIRERSARREYRKPQQTAGDTYALNMLRKVALSNAMVPNVCAEIAEDPRSKKASFREWRERFCVTYVRFVRS